jgi:hypothetical protein
MWSFLVVEQRANAAGWGSVSGWPSGGEPVSRGEHDLGRRVEFLFVIVLRPR